MALRLNCISIWLASAVVITPAHADYLYDSLGKHYSLGDAEAEIQTAYARLDSAKLSWLPDVNLTGNLYRRRFFNSNSSLPVEHDTRADAKLEGRIVLFEYYGLDKRVGKEQVGLALARYDLASRKLILWEALHSSFLRARSAKKQIAAYKDGIGQLKNLRRLAIGSVEAGELPKDTLTSIAIKIEKYTADIQLQELNFQSELTFLEAEIPHVKHSKVKFPRVPKGNGATLASISYRENPLVLSALQAVNLSKSELKEVKSELFPSIEAFASYGFDTKDYNLGKFNSRTKEGRIGVTLKIPLWFNPKETSKVDIERQEIWNKTTKVDKIRKGLRSDILQLVTKQRLSANYFKSLRSSQRKVDEQLANAFKGVRDGSVPPPSVIGDISESVDLQLSRILARTSQDLQTLELWKKIGRVPK